MPSLRPRRTILTVAVACWAAGAAFSLFPAARAQSGYPVLSWYDEFDGTSVDPGRWSFELGTGSQFGLTGWGNNELQHYTGRQSNASVANGLLSITARREQYAGQAFTSARLTTRGHFAQTGGRFEIRAALPLGQGLWPAFWMLPATNDYGGWAASGEIDILEARGQDPGKVVTTIHYGGSWPNNEYRGVTLTLPRGGSIADFHTYALEWDVAPTAELRWYIDDRLAWKTSQWWSEGGAYPAPFDKPFNLMLNLAVGGNFVGSPDGSTPFPATMQVDYVRAYQAAAADIVINVPTGRSQSQFAAGYAQVLTANSLTKTGLGELVLDADNLYTGPTAVTGGKLRVTTPRALANSAVRVEADTTLAVSPGFVAPSVRLAGGTLLAGRLAIEAAGIQRLEVASGGLAGDPDVVVGPGGMLTLAAASRATLSVASLAVAEEWGGGLIDLGAGAVRIAAGGITAADLLADLRAGRAGGSWTGTTGITSTTARNSSGGSRTIGYRIDSEGGATVSFAAPGDVDLDGTVNVFDLVAINGSGTYNTGRPAVWNEGDFTYDGTTDIFDLVAIGSGATYGRGTYFPTSAVQPALSPVPEPGGSLWVLGLVLSVAGLFTVKNPARQGLALARDVVYKSSR
jgi:autotransporter-associated beta strand protein